MQKFIQVSYNLKQHDKQISYFLYKLIQFNIYLITLVNTKMLAEQFDQLLGLVNNLVNLQFPVTNVQCFLQSIMLMLP